MGLSRTYFLDTYAFCEILKGNPSFNRFKRGITAVTTQLNLMELHYGLVISLGEARADHYYDKFRPYVIPIGNDLLKTASKFRAHSRKKNFSYIDCIGYCMARMRNARFLTGDKQFEGMEGVEYVK